VEGFQDFKRAGLLMTFENGQEECQNVSHASSSILFLCDPNAGVGYPIVNELPGDNNNDCTYSFKWESLYACPVCTQYDFYPVYGKCEAGFSVKTYVPRTFPNMCHDGEVPPPENVPCFDSSVICALGTYLPLNLDDDEEQKDQRQDDDEEQDDDACVPASPGHYSLGGGIVADVFDSWGSVPLEFGRDSTWDLLGELVRSGEGTTELKANIDVLTSGYVEFDFKIVSYGDDAQNNFGFYFYVDNSPSPYNLTDSMMFFKHSQSFPLSEGRHTLTWLFVGGVPPQNENPNYLRGSGVYAVIDKILIFGTATSARSETPCRDGSYQPREGQYSCLQCPRDTFCGGAEESYHECAEGEYALPGSRECETKKICTYDDFSSYYTECDAGQTLIYEELAPGCTLAGSNLDFSDNNTVVNTCFDCPKGFYFLEKKCQPCPLGQYLDKKEKKCVDVPAGTFAETKIVYFTTDRDVMGERAGGAGELPSNFRTFCSGKCDTEGWRVVNGLAQSGYYSPYSEVESVLYLELNFVQTGSISFSYLFDEFTTEITLDPIENSALPGFLFYVDSEQQDVIYNSVSDERESFSLGDLEPGAHNFTWVYHQPLQPTQHRQIFVYDVEIHGSSIGGAADYTNCPPGTFSDGNSPGYTCKPCAPGTTSQEGATECVLCDYDKYTDEIGSVTCSSCGVGVNATEDRTDCQTGCLFFNEETKQTFDLSPLSQRYSVNDGWGNRYEISLCEKLDPLVAQCQAETDTFICVSTASDGVTTQKDGGHIQNIYFEEREEEEGNPVLLLNYTEGSICESEEKIKTEIVFVCDPSVEFATPPMIVDSQNCWTRFEWTHRSACPVCTEEDYRVDEGSCVDGEKQILKVRNSNCNVKEILSSETVSCRKYSIPFIMLAVAFVCLLLVVIGLFVRAKQMAARYDQLVHSSNINEDGPESEADEVGDLKL